MTRQDIIDAAGFIAERNGVVPLPAGNMMGIDLDALWGEWADYADPKMVRVSGVISETTGQSYPLPGFRSAIYISVGGSKVAPVPQEYIYYNSDNDGLSTGQSGYVIMDGALIFTTSSADSDSEDFEAGSNWIAVYYSDNETIPDGAEPYIPDKLHMMLSKELAYRWRELYGGRELSGSEMMTRRGIKSKFLAEIGGRTSEKDTPIQPNWVNEL